MKTIINVVDKKEPESEVLQKAAKIFQNGGVVGFPTETVYGLGANALDERAVKKIFEAKGRPSDNPLIVHIAKEESLNELVQEIPENAKILMKKFWPGPLTLIFRKSDKVPDCITAGLSTVAIRMPSNIVANKLIDTSKLPIAAPSANTSGKPSPTLAQHVIEDLNGKIDMIIDGGACNIGVESTVLDVTSEVPVILRPGAVTEEMIKGVCGDVSIDPAVLKKPDGKLVPKAPGMKYKHYAPKADVVIVEGELDKVVRKINMLYKDEVAKGFKVGIMATEQTKTKYQSDNIISLGDRKHPIEIASSLFASLREFDDKKVDIIIAEAISEKQIGMAIMNRLTKAAAYRIIHV